MGCTKTELKIEGVFLVNTVEVDIASEKGVQIVVLAVRKCEEKFGLVPETFREAMVDWKMETL